MNSIRVATLSCLTLLVTCASASGQTGCPTQIPGFAYPVVDDTVLTLQSFPNAGAPALYLGGQFYSAGGLEVWRAIRWDGTNWNRISTFPQLAGTVRAFTTFDFGLGPRLFAGGEFALAWGHYVGWLEGTTWQPLVNPLNGPVHALCVYDDGTGPALYAGGSFTSVGTQPSQGIARWDGVTWSALASGVFGVVNALVVHDDGSGPALYAGGQFTPTAGAPGYNVARWNGTSWSDLNFGVDGGVACLASYAEGGVPRLFAGGSFTHVRSGSAWITANRIARWDGVDWTPVASGVGADEGVNALCVADEGSGPALYAGGAFTHMDGALMPAIARWNGSAWSALDQGLVGVVFAIEPFDDGHGSRLYVGGSLALPGSYPLNVLRWDGLHWSSIAMGPVHSTFSGTHAALRADLGSGEAWYAATTDALVWNGFAWVFVATPAVPSTYASALAQSATSPVLYAARAASAYQPFDVLRVSAAGTTTIGAFSGAPSAWINALWSRPGAAGESLYAGGFFTAQGTSAMHYAAHFDGTSWSALPGLGTVSTTSGVFAFAEYAGDVYAVGEFTVFADGTRGVARWNSASWAGVGTGLQGRVESLALHDFGAGTELVASGASVLPASPPVRVARWNGSAWSAMPAVPFAAGDGFLRARVFEWDEGRGAGPELFVSQTLLHAGAWRHELWRWTGTSWSLDFDHEGIGIDAHAEPRPDGTGSELVVTGQFLDVDGTSSAGLLVLEGCGETGRTFCHGDGSGAACPCGNESATLDRAGCRNSFGAGGSLRAHGNPGLTLDTLRLDAANLPSGVPCLFFQGTSPVNAGAGSAFGDGLRCAGGAVIRLAKPFTSGGAASFGFGVPGDPAIHVAGGVAVPGTRRFYQGWYRNAASFCTASTFNLTNGVDILWNR